MKKITFFAICLGAWGVTHAQQTAPEVLDSVVIDTKVPIARKNSGKVVTKITSDILDRNVGKSVAEVLNEVSGIEINGARSNAGQNLAYYVRGGRNRQVVIMVDGVQMNDPSQIANDYDLRLVPIATVAEIEIIKGASSVLYGSGAAAAVISITTKKAAAAPIAATFTSVLGSNQSASENDYQIATMSNAASVNGTLGNFFYHTQFSNTYTDGLSAIEAPDGEADFEADIFNRYDGRINLGYHFTEDISFSQFFSFNKFKAGFDNFDYTDADHLSITDQLKTGGRFEWKYRNGTYVFNDAFTWIEREIISGFPSKFDSRAYTFDTYLNHRILKNLNVLIGLNGNFSSFNSFTIPFGATDFAQDVSEDTAKFEIIDPYVNVVYISEFGLTVNAGARLNNHSAYDTHLVYNVNPSYTFELGAGLLKVLASLSTAYITPSLYQLYDPLYGNESLLPEENRTLEGGVEFTNGTDFRLSAVYFNRKETNYVDFVTVNPDLFISQYQNIDETFENSGVEVEVFKRFGTQWQLTANYTNTQAEERFALRIPEHKVNATVGYQLNKATTFGLAYQYVGDREDRFFSPTTFMSETVTLGSFNLLELTINRKISEVLNIFAGVSNLLNEDYEELFRYETQGRNARVGFSLNF
ncbi:MAG: TonB-dependent receptor [Flavobacteriaceae bacterium]|nr:TonB-dependent receptor [Flavobacteriaceae bacterium]